MFAAVFQSFLRYAKDRPLYRVALDFLLLVTVISWLSVSVIVTMNFKTFKGLYDRMVSEEDIKIGRVVKINTKIDGELLRLMDVTQSDRASVAKYHNGKVDLTGTHFIFFSRTNEVRRSGVSSEIRQMQNLPIAVFNEAFDQILQGECYVLEDAELNDKFGDFLKSQGIKSTIGCPIYSIDDKHIGYVAVNYVYRKLDMTKLDRYIQEMRQSASKIGGILSITG